MIKIFISQPMSGKSEKEILKEREEIISLVKSYFTEEVYILDSFILGAEKVDPLFCLGYSLMVLSKADYAVFGKGWRESRGCDIEHKCCMEYGISTIYIREGEIRDWQ